MEAHPLKDLINLGAEDNATAVGIHTSHRRAKSGATKAPTTSVNILGVSSKIDNWFGYNLVIPEESQLKAKRPVQGLPCCFPATQVTVPIGDIPEAGSGLLPVEVDEGLQEQGPHQKVNTFSSRDNASTAGIHTPYMRTSSGAIKVSTISL